MGCIGSRMDKEEEVQENCWRRMKHLLGLGGEVADAQLAYFRALTNTTLEIDNIPYGSALPPSPPPPLPHPPPPPFSPDPKNDDDNLKYVAVQVESFEINEDGRRIASPSKPPVTLEYLNVFDPYPSHQQLETVEQVDDDNWEETGSNFEDDER